MYTPVIKRNIIYQFVLNIIVVEVNGHDFNMTYIFFIRWKEIK